MDKYFSERLIYTMAFGTPLTRFIASSCSGFVTLWLLFFGLGLVPLIYGAVYKYHETNDIELSEDANRNTWIVIALIGLLGAIALWVYDHNTRMEYYYVVNKE